MLELPPLRIGQAVKRGDVVGQTSNTGISGQEAPSRAGVPSSRGKPRRDALHFSVMYSDSPDHVVLNRHGGYLVPVGGRWMDPVAFYRNSPPSESEAVAALSDQDKRTAIAVQDGDGNVHPQSSKLSSPYACAGK